MKQTKYANQKVLTINKFEYKSIPTKERPKKKNEIREQAFQTLKGKTQQNLWLYLEGLADNSDKDKVWELAYEPFKAKYKNSKRAYLDAFIILWQKGFIKHRQDNHFDFYDIARMVLTQDVPRTYKQLHPTPKKSDKDKEIEELKAKIKELESQVKRLKSANVVSPDDTEVYHQVTQEH